MDGSAPSRRCGSCEAHRYAPRVVTQLWFRLATGAVGLILVALGFALVIGASTRAISGLVIIAGLVLLLGAIFPEQIWRGSRKDR